MATGRRRVLAGLAAAAVWPGAAMAQTGLSQRAASDGLKDALRVAATLATEQLGQLDGFYGAPRFRIPLPGLLATAQRSLRPLGLSGRLDDLELRLNRGAEAAMPAARRLFLNAIQSITLGDALAILRGGDTAATDFLRARTQDDLTGLLRPPMQSALTDSGAFNALDRAASSAGLDPAAQNLRGQLISFAVERALDGAFTLIAEEERAICRDPVRRTTRILRQVFGAL